MHVRTPAALILTVIMATALPALPGCGPHLGGYDYNAGEARQANSIYYGTAVNVQEVNINSQSSGRQTVGALIGAFAPSVGTTIKPIGDIFLNLLFTIVVPLVFVSIASAVGSMANMKRLGRILAGTIGTFIFTGLIAAACVLIWVNLFSPSAGTSIAMTTSEVGEAKTAAELIVS